MNTRSDLPICVVKEGDLAVSETFIRAHIERLPAEVTLVHSWPPLIADRPVLSQSLVQRAQRYLWRQVAGRDGSWDTTSAYMKAFRLSHAAAVLAEYGPAGVRVSEACRCLGIPLVVHFHGYDASRSDVLQTHLENYPRLFSQAAAIIAVSLAMQRKLISLGADPQKVHYNPYGVDCEMFSCGDPGSAPPSLLAVGRFVEKKAPQLTLLAFAEAKRRCPDARLRMIGTGPLWGACQDLAIALGLSDSVTFLGAQPHPIVQKEMGQARAFVQHSVESASGDCEGTPVGILEAGARGLPVISTYHGGIPDVVIHGETGYLVAERDVSGMAEYMVAVLQRPSTARQLGQGARERIDTHFRMEKSIQRLWAIIETCIRGNRTLSH